MKFTKYMAILFFVLMALNLTVLLPVYTTAKNQVQKLEHISDFSVMTVANATSSSTRIWASFVFVLVNSLISLAFVHRFWRASLQLKHRRLNYALYEAQNDNGRRRSVAGFSEKDIALHTVLVRGLPKQNNPQTCERDLQRILTESFPDGQIISVKVIGSHSKSRKYAKEWEELRVRMNFYQNLGMNSDEENIKESCFTKAISKCLRSSNSVSGECKRLHRRMEELKYQMIMEERRTQNLNSGCFFIVFRHIHQAQQALRHQKDFIQQITQASSQERLRFGLYFWHFYKAPSYSDIIWSKLGASDVASIVKSFFLYFALFIICVILVTPLTLFDIAKPMANWINQGILGESTFRNYLPEYLAPLILALFNGVIIPLLVDLVAMMQDHETHSGKQITILILNFVFMSLNVILIPLTNYITVRQFLDFVVDALQSNRLFESLSKDMGTMGSFFMRYMMQVAFLINMLYLFDIPHFFVKTIRKLIHKYKYRHFPDKNIQAFKDTWFFDLGYFQAYGLTLFFLGLLFAVVIPLITIFSCIFFSLRYFFDKYHQTFVYFKEFEAKGRLKQHVLWILIVIIMLSQILNYAFLKVISGVDYLLGFGVAMVCLQVGVIVGMKMHQFLDEKRFTKKLALERMQSEQHISSQRLMKLKASYRHPWYDQREKIFDYYNAHIAFPFLNNNISESPSHNHESQNDHLFPVPPESNEIINQFTNYQDLNVQDSADFKLLRNLEPERVGRAMRKTIAFICQEEYKDQLRKSMGKQHNLEDQEKYLIELDQTEKLQRKDTPLKQLIDGTGGYIGNGQPELSSVDATHIVIEMSDLPKIEKEIESPQREKVRASTIMIERKEDNGDQEVVSSERQMFDQGFNV